MFRSITRLLFGGEEETSEDVTSGEVVEEGWLVVGHQEAGSAEIHGAEVTDTQPSKLALHSCSDTAANMETDSSAARAEPADQRSSTSDRVITSLLPQLKVLSEATQVACIQKAKTWADRHHMTRNAIQRQNRVRQGVQHSSIHLQQPGHRSLSH